MMMRTMKGNRMIDAMKQNPTANLSWSLYVDCPKCDHTNDLADSIHDTENHIAGYIFSNNWAVLTRWEVRCEKCTHKFFIGKVEY